MVGSLEKACNFIWSHKHVARFGSFGGAYDAHLLHLIHESAGFVEAYFKFSLKTGD